MEKQLIEIIATDRIDIPISSMSGKLKRKKPKLAKALDFGKKKSFEGDRTYARVKTEDKMKARGMREGINLFSEEFPRYGKILNGMIEEKRAKSETHLYFGMYEGCRLTSDDYMSVMTDLGFSEQRAESLYQELMKVSRNLTKKREEERSVMIG
tara:strand:- start:1838 stop:2299 length:462 start_codon:yes stop_codon:yes gene_type:complete